jgi:hypothetical protein
MIMPIFVGVLSRCTVEEFLLLLDGVCGMVCEGDMAKDILMNEHWNV